MLPLSLPSGDVPVRKDHPSSSNAHRSLPQRPAPGKQGPWFALLDHFFIPHHDDPIRLLQEAPRLLRPRFRQRINRARRLVQNQNPGIGDQGAGEADELPLPESQA